MVWVMSQVNFQVSLRVLFLNRWFFGWINGRSWNRISTWHQQQLQTLGSLVLIFPEKNRGETVIQFDFRMFWTIIKIPLAKRVKKCSQTRKCVDRKITSWNLEFFLLESSREKMGGHCHSSHTRCCPQPIHQPQTFLPARNFFRTNFGRGIFFLGWNPNTWTTDGVYWWFLGPKKASDSRDFPP